MKTVIIKIGELQDGTAPEGKVYPVTMYVDDGSNPNWLTEARADTVVPQDFLAGQPPPAGSTKTMSEEDVVNVLARAGNSPLFEHVGHCLYRVLFSGAVGVEWDALQAGLGKGEALRTVLDIEPRRLSEMPWELLKPPNSPTRGPRRHLFLDPNRPFVRGRRDAFALPRREPEWPLRALVVVGSAPDDGVIDAREEVSAILGALRRMGRTAHTEVLLRPSKQKLINRYREFMPHIFHFIGHGGALPGQRPRLRLYDEKEKKITAWSVDDIQHDLSGCDAASFAFINACRTTDVADAGGRDANVTPDSSLSIIEAFADTGIPAVLGMMANVTEDVAQAFTHCFYTELAAGKDVDVALCEARQRVNQLPGLGVGQRHWAVASLSLGVAPDNVLAIESQIPLHMQDEIRNDNELKKLGNFVDRQDQRLSLVKLDPYYKEDKNKSLQLVYGASSVGKSSLVQLFMECCAMRGRKFLLVNMKGMKTINFVEALCQISMGYPESNTLLEKPLQPRTAFNQFHWELPYLLKGVDPPLKMPSFPPGTVIDAPSDMNLERLIPDYQNYRYSRAFTHRGLDARNDSVHLKRIFSTFGEALMKVAEGNPLIIALDHLMIDARDFENYFVKYLLLPIKKHELSPVRMILVLSQENIKNYNLNDPESPLYIGNGISLSNFTKEELDLFAYEFFRYNRVPPERAIATIEFILGAKWAAEGCAPGKLEKLLDFR